MIVAQRSHDAPNRVHEQVRLGIEKGHYISK
jgi:hypothetical protein